MRESGTDNTVYISGDDVQKHGFTPRCPGCNAIRNTIAKPAGHNEASRARIIEKLRETEAVNMEESSLRSKGYRSPLE